MTETQGMTGTESESQRDQRNKHKKQETVTEGKKKAVGNSKREMRHYEKIGSTRMEGKGRHGTKWRRIFLVWEKLLGSEGVGGF